MRHEMVPLVIETQALSNLYKQQRAADGTEVESGSAIRTAGRHLTAFGIRPPTGSTSNA